MFKSKGWFDTSEVDELGRTLAQELAQRYTQEMDLKPTDKKNETKLGLALNGIYGKAREFKSTHKLGVYRKARLGNSFKWELKEMGYRDEFIEEATRGLVLSISKK